MAVTIGRTAYTFDDDVGAPKPAAKVTPFVEETVEPAESPPPKPTWKRKPKAKPAPAAAHVWCRVCTARKVETGDDVCRRKDCQTTRARWALLALKLEKQE